MRGSGKENRDGLLHDATNDNQGKGNTGNVGATLNILAREQMKYKLMCDIAMDIEVCKLENIDYKTYLRELKQIIDGFLGEDSNE